MFQKKPPQLTDEEIFAKGLPQPTYGIGGGYRDSYGAMTVSAFLAPFAAAGTTILGALIGVASAGPIGFLVGGAIGFGLVAVPIALFLTKMAIGEVFEKRAIAAAKKNYEARKTAFAAAVVRLEKKYEGRPEARDAALTEAFNKQRALDAQKPTALQRAAGGYKKRTP